MFTRLQVLQSLSFGKRIAEDEANDLAKYFVETEQWRIIFNGNADVIYGAKGSGKSAIYALLKRNESDLFSKNTILVFGESPRGTPVFSDLVNDPPTSEAEFANLWKLYFVSLVGTVLKEYSMSSAEAEAVIRPLEDANLIEGPNGLRALLRAVTDYVRRLPRSLEVTAQLDPSTAMPSVTGRIVFAEPSQSESLKGAVSVDYLFGKADSALSEQDITLWLLMDRLDVAFTESEELESNALRALFKVYRDLAGLNQIRLKIFLRTDIWARITREQGFREASHITKSTTIRWDKASLTNLIVRRATQSVPLLEYRGMTAVEALSSKQDDLLARIFPDQVDIGPNKSKTIDWILARTRDGSQQNAPRELIHFLETTRLEEITRIENEPLSTEDSSLFSRQAIRTALPEVSRVRLETVLYAEYPILRPFIEALSGEKSTQYLTSLARIWKVQVDEAKTTADRLWEVGLFEVGGTKDDPEYKVPFLYRPALHLIQGAAEQFESES